MPHGAQALLEAPDIQEFGVVGRIGVVTVTFNSATVLPDFLASVESQSYRQYRLYAIDNASSDASVKMLEANKGIDLVVVRNTENLGVAEGNNQGIRLALEDGCTHVLLLNNDTVFSPDLFAALMRTADSEHQSMVIPKMLYHEPANRIWCAGGQLVALRGYAPKHFGEGELDDGGYDEDRIVEYGPTCCMLIESRVFDTVGLMDPKYFVYNDDVDFCVRASRRGIGIWYVHSAVLWHKVGSLTGGAESPFVARMGTRNKVYFLKKNLGLTVALVFCLAYFPYLLQRSVRGQDEWSRFALKCRSLLEGIRM